MKSVDFVWFRCSIFGQ